VTADNPAAKRQGGRSLTAGIPRRLSENRKYEKINTIYSGF